MLIFEKTRQFNRKDTDITNIKDIEEQPDGLAPITIQPSADTKELIVENNIDSDMKDTASIGNEELDELIEIAGYSYDPIQDIFISTIRPWQRWIGYCRLFDEAAAPLGMIIDCDPIRFDYQGKRWMLGIWKGQYDLVCGGEIGFYQSIISSSGIFYKAVEDNDMLEMSYTLKKNGEVLFTRHDKHWWLTGFKLGVFAQPSELMMDIRITLKDITMRDAFLAGMRQAGYKEDDIFVMGNTVNFLFDQPRTPQPHTRTRLTDWVIQQKNKFLCEKFNEITGDQGTAQEKLKLIEEQAPWILKRIRKMNTGNVSMETWALFVMACLVTVYLVAISAPDETLDNIPDNSTEDSVGVAS